MYYNEKIKKHKNDNGLELALNGLSNGISTQLAKKQATYGSSASLDFREKSIIIENAAKKFGEFLTALGVDWENDPNSSDTPKRVSKAYVLDLWKGRYESLSDISTFPNENYDGIIFEGGIPLTSMCSHHHQTIAGVVHIGYIPTIRGRLIGLSKLNRIVEHFGRRAVIQENLTTAIHNAIEKICESNIGVAVMISASHNCVKCRGVKHQQSLMVTHKFSGIFLQTQNSSRTEFYEFIREFNK